MTYNDKSYVSQLLNVGLERQGSVRRREDIEIAMDEVMMSIVPQLEKRTPYTALFANLATLLGLLGTIMGLIEAFEAVATAAPSEKSALLSASISEAMSCTAFGLIVAMPMLAANLYLNLKASTIIDGLEMASLKTVNTISSFNAKNRN
jgi:biopolymer transport protein ExbB